jgi:hypothetical protein
MNEFPFSRFSKKHGVASNWPELLPELRSFNEVTASTRLQLFFLRRMCISFMKFPLWSESCYTCSLWLQEADKKSRRTAALPDEDFRSVAPLSDAMSCVSELNVSLKFNDVPKTSLKPHG